MTSLALILALLLSGCGSALPGAPTATPPSLTGTPSLTPGAPYPAPSGAAPTPTNAPSQGPLTLVVWLPPQFDPSGTLPGSDKLRARLDSFQAANPDLKIQVRIKAASGTGGLLDALTATSAAAPDNLPAIIALPRSDMETATLKGLIFPMDGLKTLIDDPDWYDFAHQLAYIQGSPYGIPFAGDALLLMYRPAAIPAAPADWPALFHLNQPVAFPAGDPQGLFTLLLYLSAGGSVKDAQGRPTLQADVLGKALKLFADGMKENAFSSALVQYQSDVQSWLAFRNEPPKAQAVVSWSSRYLSELPADTTAAVLPSLGQQPYTLATGWVWALSDPDPQLRAAAQRLAAFLGDSAFLSQWSAAAGYLPTRPSALAGWSNQSLKTILSPIVLAAQVRPSNDLLASLGPVLQDATIKVIKQGADPLLVAQTAADRLAVPPSQ